MASVVLRIRLVGNDHMDVSYEDITVQSEKDLLEYVIQTLGRDSGALRTRHGDREVVIFGRGVACVEVSPRGPVL